MAQQEKRFTARRVDAQFEECVQAVFPPLDTPNTPNNRVVEGLRTLYGEQIEQEQQSLERMRQRLSVAVAASQHKKPYEGHEDISALDESIKLPEKRVPVRLIRPQRPWLKALERGLVALLVMAIVAGWVALSHWPHSFSGSQIGFNDASASSLGEPVSTIKGNFNGIYEWSPDSRTFAFLQVDTQKNELDIHMLDIASGHTSIYPVLDSSWIPALKNDPFQILMGRYLLAVRAQGDNQASMMIWDITGQRAITTQTIPARIGGDSQVLLPSFASSHNEQKLATYFSDGTVAIWDVASGQKLVTCEGKIPLSSPDRPVPPRIQWYDHDQDLQFYSINPDGNFQLDTCEVSTGTSLFSLSDANKTASALKVSSTYATSIVSPDNKYLALAWGSQSTAGGSYSGRGTSLEILDAQSGQVLHSHFLDRSSQTATGFFWLPDSQRLLLYTTHYSNNTSTSSLSYPSVQISTWNAFTDQTTVVASSSQVTLERMTSDGRYLILGTPDGRTMEIWQTSNGQKVATVTTPGVYARSDSFFYTNNQQIVIGQKGDFDIWDIPTGQLMYKYHGSTPFSIAGVSGSIVFWSPDGKYLTMMAGKGTSMDDGVLSIWRIP